MGWQRGSGTLLLVMGGGAFCFSRTIVVREPGITTPATVHAQLVAFPTSVQLVALQEEMQKGGT